MFNVLDYLPAYFDTDPQAVFGLRIVAPGHDISWKVENDVLTLTWNNQTKSYSLVDETLYSLANLLQADGLSTPWWDSDRFPLGAAILREGSGTGDGEHGALLEIWTSTLWSLVYPVDYARRDFLASRPNAIQQINLSQAQGWWLDRQGLLYGIKRPPGASDADYLALIYEEIYRPRDNPRGIDYTLRRRLDWDIRVTEPWQYLAKWDFSELSGGHHFHDGVRWSWNLIQLEAVESGDWESAQSIADSDRPAGTILLGPQWSPNSRKLTLSPHVQIETSSHDMRGHWWRGLWHLHWDWSALSVDQPTLNYKIIISDTYGNYGNADLQEQTIFARYFCRGEQVWSEDTTLSDDRYHLPGGDWIKFTGDTKYFDNDVIGTGGASNYLMPQELRKPCEWTHHDIASSIASESVFSIGTRTELFYGTHFKLAIASENSYPWVGAWDERRWGLPEKWQIVGTYERIIYDEVGDETIWSDGETGGISDYIHSLNIIPVPYDPYAGTSWDENGRTISFPPLLPPEKKLDAPPTRSVINVGFTPTFSSIYSLSDSEWYMLCDTSSLLETQYFSDQQGLSNLYPVSCHAVRWLGGMPTFSGSVGLSNYTLAPALQ